MRFADMLGSDLYYQLTEDIDMDEVVETTPTEGNWSPIGLQSGGFSGTFDGGGYTISNITISDPTGTYVGMFTDLSGGTVYDLGLLNVQITGENEVGAIAGLNNTGSTIQNCFATGTVTADFYAGGLVGTNRGSIKDSYAVCDIVCANYLGGIAGYNTPEGTIDTCYAMGRVVGNEAAGGIVGYSGGTVSTCVALNPAVTGSVEAGRVIGWADSGTVDHNFARDDMGGSTEQFEDIPAEKSESGKDGADIPLASALDNQWWTVDIGYTDPWWTSEHLPQIIPPAGENEEE
jgi:hypothetical protein